MNIVYYLEITSIEAFLVMAAPEYDVWCFFSREIDREITIN